MNQIGWLGSWRVCIRQHVIPNHRPTRNPLITLAYNQDNTGNPWSQFNMNTYCSQFLPYSISGIRTPLAPKTSTKRSAMSQRTSRGRSCTWTHPVLISLPPWYSLDCVTDLFNSNTPPVLCSHSGDVCIRVVVLQSMEASCCQCLTGVAISWLSITSQAHPPSSTSEKLSFRPRRKECKMSKVRHMNIHINIYIDMRLHT